MTVAPSHVAITTPGLAEQNAQLAARVRELEHLLRLERSRNKGLEHGLSSLSERVVSLRHAAAGAVGYPQGELSNKRTAPPCRKAPPPSRPPPRWSRSWRSC